MKQLRHIGLLITLALCWCVAALAQGTTEEPKQLKEITSTEGREFFVAWLPNGGSDLSSTDLKLLLLASSRVDNAITVEFANGASMDYTIEAGKTTTITIDAQSVYWDPANDEEEKPLSKGIRVYSSIDEVFTLFSINQTGTLGTYSYDGAHILPIEALGTEYMVTTNDVDATATEFVIMSTKPDATNVTMELKVNSRRGSTQQLSFTLNGSKQIYIVRSKAPDPTDPEDAIDLSGSTICADQPIAVWSGNQNTLIPNQDGLSTDHAYDQLLPVTRWGKEFIVPMTALKTKRNAIRITALQDGTDITVKVGTNTQTFSMTSGSDTTLNTLYQPDSPTPQNFTRYITATKPIQVYLFTSSAGMNTWDDYETGESYTPSDPSMTIIPPLEFLTDTTIFRTYNGGDGKLKHQINLWALSSQTSNIELDGQPISGWKTIPTNTAYSQVTCDVEDTTHILTAPTKSFSGYAYGIANGQAYLYPVGYDFTPKKDSLFLMDNDSSYAVRPSEWRDNYVSDTEGGWYLDKILQEDNTYLLDSIFICDSTILKFPIKTYNVWYKTIWEIEGSIRGDSYFEPLEQLSEDVARPELEHQFTLLPIKQNRDPFEDFEVRGIVIHKPLFCEDIIPEDKWERDTFNTVVRVMRQYNDTVWRAICVGDTVQFFRDTVWKVDPTAITGKPEEGTDYEMQITIFNDTTHDLSRGLYQYQVGSDSITRHYISSGGCDSLSTLMLFVCAPSYQKVDTVVCEDSLKHLSFGKFFEKYSASNKWPKKDTTLFDTIRAKGCMTGPEWRKFRPHCRDFNGCDSVMELHLKVMTVVRNTYPGNICMTQLAEMGGVYRWVEKNSVPEREIHVFNPDTMDKDRIYTFRDTVKYKNCPDCTEGGCDSVRNVLTLQFISDDGQEHVIHVCQNKDTVYKNMGSSYHFSPVGKQCNTPYPYKLEVIVRSMAGEELCRFTDSLTFFVDTVYRDQMTYDTVCIDPTLEVGTQTYAWKNHPKYSAIKIYGPGLFTYRDTIPTYDCHCDSICVLKLRVGQPEQKMTNTTICDDDAFTWQDTLFYGINYKETIPAGQKSKQVTGSIYTTKKDTFTQYGCDSTLKLILHINPTFVAEQKDTAICADEPYYFYGTWYNTPANPWKSDTTYILEIHDKSVHLCDSMVQHNVTVHPIYLNQQEANDTICQVLSPTPVYYTWEGDHADWNAQHLQKINNAGTFNLTDYKESQYGCDSIIHRTLVILPTYDDTIPHLMNSEDTIHWEGRIYAGVDAVFDNNQGLPVVRSTGLQYYTDHLSTKTIGTHFCDSIRTLKLAIGKVFRDTVFDATCVNCGTYFWTITSPKTGIDTVIPITDLPAQYEERFYYDSLLTDLDFDSIFVLRLTGYPHYDFDEPDEICQGDVYTWPGHTPGENGVVHRLFVNHQPITVIPTDAYGEIQVVDSMLTDTIFTNPKTGEIKRMQCDSVWTLNLTIHETYNDRYVLLSDTFPMSSNDTLSYFTQPHVLFVGYDFDFEAAGVTKEDFKQQFDTVIYIQPTGDETWRDSVTNPSQYNCDSVHYIVIHICEITFTQLRDTIADNDTIWSFGGETEFGKHTLPLVTGHKFHYYDDGTPVDYTVNHDRLVREYLFIDTLRTIYGCDSIVHDSVIVFPSYRFEEEATICSNEKFDWRKYDYLNRYKTGYVYDSVNYKAGTHTIDSVYALNLHVVPSGYYQFDTVLCMNDTLLWQYQKIYYRPGGMTYVEAIYKDPESMCGDIYHMDLTFMPVYSTSLLEYDTICQYDEYHWFTEGEVNEHLDNIRDGKGHKLEKIPTDEYGDFVFYDSLKTTGCGCDSVYTLKLHIKQSYHLFDTSYVYCSADTLLWYDQQYYYQGEPDIYDTIFGTATNGCDSIHFMHVHFNLSYDTTETVFLCSDVAHYQWEDIVFDDTLRKAEKWLEPRTYQYSRTYPALGGCDSVLRLEITIAPNFDSIWTDTICRGETYDLFGQQLTTAGFYTAEQPNIWGCKTFYYLTLREVPAPNFDIHVDPVCVDREGMANVYQLHYSLDNEFEPISYSVHYDSIAQAMGFEDEEDIPLASGQRTIDLAVPQFMNQTDYPRPGYYEAVISFNNGVCLSDSLMTYPFTMTMQYPSWVIEQPFNDVLALLDAPYNGGYTWTSYQWYENDEMLIGQTQPYLHVPTGLNAGSTYSVALTRSDDAVTVHTCPTIATTIYDGYAPTMGYLGVTPTCVVAGHPIIHILSRKPGTYRITTSDGHLVSQGVFQPDVTEVMVPSVSGMYIVQLWSNDTPEEPYRAIKIVVRDQCPNCDISSF